MQTKMKQAKVEKPLLGDYKLIPISQIKSSGSREVFEEPHLNLPVKQFFQKINENLIKPPIKTY